MCRVCRVCSGSVVQDIHGLAPILGLVLVTNFVPLKDMPCAAS